jgi:hypothetical protein
MKCEEARVAIRASVDSDGPLDARTQAHLAICDDCSEDLGDWRLDRALSLQPAEVPDEDFVDRAIAHAIHENSIARRRRMAFAASIGVMTVAFGLMFGQVNHRPSPVTAVAQVTLTAHQGKTVRVVIDSPEEQNAATVVIQLADNLELAGFPNERRIEWRTNLSEGKNLLALPLTLMDEAESHFDVALWYGKTKQDVRVAVYPATNSSEAKRAEA